MRHQINVLQCTRIQNYEQLLLPSFLLNLERAELHANKTVYLKAVRVTLIALGYDENYINGEFREKLEETYKD